MSSEPNSAPDIDERSAYQIRLKGCLGNEWAEWFGCLSVTADADGTTLLISPAIDQAALHGLLKKVRDLGMRLISINPIGPDRPTADSSHLHTKRCEA